MIINPSVFLGWNGVFKNEVNHLAISAPAVFSAGEYTVQINLAVSSDGRSWFPQKVRGGLEQFTKSVGGNGAFDLRGVFNSAGAWWAYGAIRKAGGASEGALFRAMDGMEWSRVLTGFETTSNRPPLWYGDAQGNTLAFLKEFGGIVYSLDGGATWAERTDVFGRVTDFGPGISGVGIVAAAGAIAVAGRDNSTDSVQIKTASSPSGSFTSRGAPWGGKGVSLLTRGGDIALGFSIRNPALGTVRAAYAPLSNLAQSWGDAGLADDSIYIDRAFYALGRWYAGSAAGGWRMSTGAAGVSGVGGWAPVSPPWQGSAGLNSGYERDGQGFAHFGLGQIAVSGDGAEWDVIESSGLEPVRYLAAAT
jgi:hypothetical protein